VSRKREPDFSGIRIRDPDEDNRNIRIAIGKNSDSLPIEHSIIRIACGTGAELPQAAHEGAVHQHLQLLGQVRAFRVAARGAHLQVIGGGLVISSLRACRNPTTAPEGVPRPSSSAGAEAAA